MKANEIIRQYQVKAKNKRVVVSFFKNEGDGKHYLHINKKELIGKWQNRKIDKQTMWFSIETYLIVKDILNIFNNDEYYMKVMPQIFGKIKKEKLNCKIYKKEEAEKTKK